MSLRRLFGYAGLAFAAAYAASEGDAGGGGAPAPEAAAAAPPPPVAAPEPVEHVLVREVPDPVTPAPAPAPEAPAAAAPVAAPPVAAPAVTPVAAPAPENADLKALRDELALMRQTVEQLRQPPPAPAAAPAAAPAPEPDALERELSAIAADDFEIDVAKTPKDLAKAMLAERKRMDAEIKRLREEGDARVRQATESARQQVDAQQAYQQLQTEVAAKGADLKTLHQQAAAEAAGYKRFGEEAFRTRTAELLQDKIDRLQPAATPAAAAPATTPAAPAKPGAVPLPKPTAPVAPPTPGGAQARFPNTGGNPQPAKSPVLTEDEIYSRHTLVK